MKTKNIVIWVALLAVLVIAAIIAQSHPGQPAQAPTIARSSGAQPIVTTTFKCNEYKTIGVSFYTGTSTPSTSANRPPTPGGSVALTLSDGRTMTLAQTVSADGGRYANPDESIVFWNVGDTATITENGTTTYANCTTIAQ